MMGAGKTHVGREAARALGYRFIDLDELISKNEGKKVQDLFRERGEQYFRELESRELEKLAGSSKVVLSTGGGAPLQPGNLAAMRKVGTVVYLKAGAALLTERLRRGKVRRPLLAGVDDKHLGERINELLLEREPTYSQADITIEVEGQSTLAVVDAIRRISSIGTQ
jgi:shikimate kinase